MSFFYNINEKLAKLNATESLNESKQTKKNVEEADVEEGNEFSGELKKARAAGKKEFEVDGKTYPVKEDAKPDYIDLDKDGDRKESMKKAAKDKKKMSESGDVMDEELDEAWMAEKWDAETTTSDEKKGMFKGKNKAELQKQLSKLKASGPHEKGSAAYTKMKQLQFAIRAKSGWGEVSEEQEHTFVAVHARKGKTEVKGTSSYDAAKKAAAKWGLKNTSGIDVYRSDITHTAVDETVEQNRDIPLKGKSSPGTDFEAAKASEKVKLKTNRGVEPGADLDEGWMSAIGLGDVEDAVNVYKKHGLKGLASSDALDDVRKDAGKDLSEPKSKHNFSSDSSDTKSQDVRDPYEKWRNDIRKSWGENPEGSRMKVDGKGNHTYYSMLGEPMGYFDNQTNKGVVYESKKSKTKPKMENAKPVEYNDDKPAYNGMTFESVTRKHFQQIADLLKNIENMDKRRELAQHHADIFATQNPRFSKEKFFKAVGIDALEEEMKVGDERTSSTGGTIKKTRTGVTHTAKAYDPDEEETDAPKRKRGGQAKVEKEYSFPKDEKALAAHKKQAKGRVHKMDEEELDEKAVSQAQQKAAGIALAAKRAGKKLTGKSASAEMEKMPTKELEKFASTKHKGLPKKVKEEDASYPSDVPTVGAASSVSKPGKSMGIKFGKGVYEALDAQLESLIKLNESINMTVTNSAEDNGEVSKQVTVTAEGDAADQLASLLKNAGIVGGEQSPQQAAEVCPGCGDSPCGCGPASDEGTLVVDLEEADVSVSENEPDYPTNGEESDDALQYSGGLNGPKSTGQTTVPVVASQLSRQATMEEAAEPNSFFNLYKAFKNLSK